MSYDGKSKRVAVIGGLRIPFCRANTGYKDSTNQEMMTAVLQAIVKKFNLQNKSVRHLITLCLPVGRVTTLWFVYLP